MIAAAILAGEAAFWIVLLSGLTARYVLGRPRLGAALLLGVPLVDVVLLAVTAVHLAEGAQADWTHGLAAVYLGLSVVMGPALIRRVDRRFARHFADAPPSTGHDAAAGRDRVAEEWRLWLRWVLAALVASAVLGALILVGGDANRTRALWANGGWFAQLGAVTVVWLIVGPVAAGVAHRLNRSQLGDPIHMTTSRRPQDSGRWAPWWAYLVPILALNSLRQVLVPPGDVGDGVSVALAVSTAAAVAVLVTALHRSLRGT